MSRELKENSSSDTESEKKSLIWGENSQILFFPFLSVLHYQIRLWGDNNKTILSPQKSHWSPNFQIPNISKEYIFIVQIWKLRL